MSNRSPVLHQAKASFSFFSISALLMLTICVGACVSFGLPAGGSLDPGESRQMVGVDPVTGRSPADMASAAGVPTKVPEFVPHEIVFKLKLPGGDHRSEQAKQALARVTAKHQLKHADRLFRENARGRLRNIYRSKLPAAVSPLNAAAEMKKDPDIEWAEPNYIVHTCRVPVDPWYPDQWHLPKIDAPTAWDITTGSEEVVIAILDTGVELDHPDLNDRIWTNVDEQVGDGNSDGFPGVAGVDDDGDGLTDEDSEGREPGDPGYTNDLKDDDDENGFVDDISGYDFVSVPPSEVYEGEDPGPRDNDPSDFHGHGTHCAGIAGAEASDLPGQIGVAGVNWTVTLMAVRAGYKGTDERGHLANTDIAAGAKYAMQNGADIISMSFGGSVESSLITEAMQDADDAGVVLIAAACNSSTDWKFYPAALPFVLSVSATTSSDFGTWFTNFGSWVDVAAPGDDIMSTVMGGGYEAWSGTSMACPIAAGIAALCLARTPTLTNDQIRQILKSTGDEPQGNVYLGIGRVNAAAAVDKTDIAIAQLDPALDDVWIPVDPVPINGTASGQYTLYYGIGVYPTSWTQIATGGPITNGLLGTFDVNQLEDVVDYVSIRLLVDEGLATQAEDRAVFWVEIWDDSSYLPGWPQLIPPVGDVPSGIGSSPVVADLNNDGVNELFALSDNGQAYLWHPDGSVVPEWPKVLPSGIHNSITVAVANIDGGDDLEIVVPTDVWADYYCKVDVWKYDGSSVPGWPRSMGVGSYMGQFLPDGPPMVGDIDGDGNPEIVCSTYSYYDENAPRAVYAWRPDGTLVPGWPLLFQSALEPYRHTMSMALADLDNDDALDVVIPYRTYDFGPQVTVVDGSGNTLPGWPVGCGDPWGVSVGDLEGDGDLEIVVGTDDGVDAFDHLGNALTGWAGGQFDGVHAAPALGDVNGDGDLEIAFQDTESNLNLCDKNGALLPGWPQPTGTLPSSGMILEFTHFPGASIADINGDSQPDILCGGVASAKLYAFDISGTTIPGFPKHVGHALFSIVVTTPEITDLNGDGLSDIVLGALDGKVYVWGTTSPVNDRAAEWPRLGNQLARWAWHIQWPSGPIVRVSPTGSDSNDGSCWANAKQTIQAAVDASPVDGEIWVAEGVYNEHVIIPKPVRLYGGLEGGERTLVRRRWWIHPTIIDSQDTGIAVTVANAASPGVRIDGFTIRSTPNGTGAGVRCDNSTLVLANDKLSHNHAQIGGGLYATDSSVTLENCTVEYNTADGGGAVYMDGCSGAISGSTFSNNSAQYYGGAVYLNMSSASVSGCSFASNSAQFGGAVVMYSDVGAGITDCTFTGNTCQDTGGAVYNAQSATGVVARCTFSGNQGTTGGGIYFLNSSPLVAQCTFLNNVGTVYGGAIHCDSCSSPSIQNCILNGNTAADGAGIACTLSTPSVVNNTIVQNTATGSGGGFFTDQGSSDIRNNVIAFNSHGVTAVYDATPILTYNDVYGNIAYDYSPGLTPGEGSISADPALVDLDGGDFALSGLSDCIDAGTNAGAPAVDFNDRPRPEDGNGDGTARCDMGAFEFKCWFVKLDSQGVQNGTSWYNAFHVPDQAMYVALPGDEIWVAAEEYGDTPLSMKDGVKLYGGFAGNELSRKDRDWETNVTTIFANYGEATIIFSSTNDLRTRLDGFRIISPEGQCTGILCDDALGVIENNTITGNPGGGIRCTNGSAPTVRGNKITGNTADNGAAVYVEWSSPILDGNVISGNTAAYRGGAVYLTGIGTPILTNNVITGNSAPTGAGVYICYGVDESVVTNNTIWGNDATIAGGGIYMDWNDEPAIHNNVIGGNTGYGIYYYADDGCGTLLQTSGELRNNNLYDNSPANYGNVIPEETDISADPLFADAAFHISGASPCREAGYNSASGLPAQDMDGQPRLISSAVDIGADEYALFRVAKTGSDANSGVTWPLAKLTIQGALDVAVDAPVEIWVATGEYLEGITINDRVALYGGFAGTEESIEYRSIVANETILDGEGQAISVVRFAWGAGNQSRLDGFTVRNGSDPEGAGINCSGASPVIANNTIKDNYGAWPSGYGTGGGIRCGGNTTPLIDSNTLFNNTSLFGGGIYSDAQCQPTIVNNVIYSNHAIYDAYEQGSGGWGGGIYCGGGGQIVNNTIHGNTSNPTIGGVGGGIYCPGSPVITNNVITWNTDGISGGTPTLAYNDVFGNADYNYSAGLDPGTGSISANPFYIKKNQGDFHLRAKSPCIDAGQPECFIGYDRDGRVRPIDGDGDGTPVCDIGAYETPTDMRGAARLLAEGSQVNIISLCVTACFLDADPSGQNWVYVETADRTSGIRVKTPQGFSIGELVDVSGTMQTDTQTGERYIDAAPDNPQPAGGTLAPLAPIGLCNLWLGGHATGYEPAIKDGFGLYNVGLLMQTWGRVTYRNPGAHCFYINDGSDLQDGSGYTGLKVVVPSGVDVPQCGAFVKVKGIGGASVVGTNYVRTLRVRMQSDITNVSSWVNSQIPLATSCWNALSVPDIPAYPWPEYVFVGSPGGPGIQLGGYLKSYDVLEQEWIIYGEGCPGRQECLAGLAHMLYIPPDGATSYVCDRTPVDNDQLISLPVGSETAQDFSLSGHSFNTSVPWGSCLVTDGSWIGTLPEAVECGFIHGVSYWDGSDWQEVTDLSTGDMSARTAYQVYPRYNDLVMIVPAQ